jgi:hypothetical protein
MKEILLRSVIVAGIFGSVVGTSQAQDASFPSTAVGIHVFEDQLPAGLSDQMVRFLATHVDGTQKMTLDSTNRFRAVNPNWTLLHYQLGVENGPVDYIINGGWDNDFASTVDVPGHEGWFVHDDNGQRIKDSIDIWYQMDISNPDWRQYWLDSVIQNLRATGSNAVFADSFTGGIGGAMYDQPLNAVRYQGINAADPAYWPGGVTWTDQLGQLIDYVQAGLHATPEQFKFIPNLDARVTSWEPTGYYQNVDGAFLEGFGEFGATYFGAPSDWILSMNRGLDLVNQDKIVIMQPYIGQPDSIGGLKQRTFLLATYLLLKGNHTYVNIVSSDGGSPYYFPEYQLDLGPATTPLPTDVSQYLWNGVYRRDYVNGIVLVNPNDNIFTLDLGGNYQLVSSTGGGSITDAHLDDSGNYIGGVLLVQAVSIVTLPPGTAVILLTSGTSSQP